MKLFNLVELNFDSFAQKTKTYFSQILAKYNLSMMSSRVYAQILNVVNSAIQQVMLYVEDSLNEQNKYNATRKKSIYSLASLSGYEPSLGRAARGVVVLQPMSTNTDKTFVMNNHTRLMSLQNNLTYNVVLSGDAMTLSPRRDNARRRIAIVEGVFEQQSFIATGGELYTVTCYTSGDVDIDFTTVRVNGELYTRASSLYDMTNDGTQYIIRTSMDNGIDIIFGNDEYGRAISDGDTIDVEYLTHSGEQGNILATDTQTFVFRDNLYTTDGDELNANESYYLTIDNNAGLSSGTYSERTSQVREMIGFNSRSLVLATPENFHQYLSRFSFVGYNRTWVDRGTMIVNALILKNVKRRVESGDDYYALRDIDFVLSDDQRTSIVEALNDSNAMMAGSILNVIDVTLREYAVYVYVKMKTNVTYNTNEINDKIRSTIATYFASLTNDNYVPKSDLIHAIKSSCDAIDGINLFFLSRRNEEAITNGEYTQRTYKYNYTNNTYDVVERRIALGVGENPQLGLDSFGNISLDGDDEYPVLRGGWSYTTSNASTSTLTTMAVVADAVNITYE